MSAGDSLEGVCICNNHADDIPSCLKLDKKGQEGEKNIKELFMARQKQHKSYIVSYLAAALLQEVLMLWVFITITIVALATAVA